MKRLVIFDFDGTLIDSPEKESGKVIWKQKTGQDYPYDGWWGRKESLNTDVFDIRPFPSVLAQLEREKATPDTKVVILTARMEKLRPEIENILSLNNIVVDDVILKKGGEGKGDIILRIQNYNPDLKEIVVYDDFMNKNAVKVAEYTVIEDKLPEDVQYILYFVDKGKISLMECSAKLLKIIKEEINNFN